MKSLSLFKKLISVALVLSCLCMHVFGQDVIDTASHPEVFAQGIVSTPFAEWATSFTPDGKTVYFSQSALYWTICFSKINNGQWMKPQVADFSGKWSDTDPFISPDGRRLFFVSNRPPANAPQDKPQQVYHLWYTDRISENKWSDPHPVSGKINLDGVNNYAPSVSRSGDLYFCSRGRDGHADMASYCAKWVGDHYEKPHLLLLNGNDVTQDPFIAPDERYLLFVDNGQDLYICYKQGDGWSTAQKLGAQVNNGDSNSSPCVSPDGKMLYYSSSRIRGFYKRDRSGKPLNYDQLLIEMRGIYNGNGNILRIPVNLATNMN